jgi:N-acetylglucosaminyl-diphospho-decaprenol L-rhamnosyltransferase
MQLSIIVVNYNSGIHLRNCLESLYRSNGAIKDFKITVYDNNSTDHSLTYACNRFSKADFIRGTENIGFAPAINAVLARTRSEYVLLVNPDVVVFPGAIDMLYRFMETNTRCGIVGGEVLGPHGHRQPTCRRFPTFFNVLFGRRSLIRRLWSHNRFSAQYLYLNMDTRAAQKVDFVEGSLMMIRRKALKEVGFFDEGFFLYLEDADLCYRMHAHGWETWWLPHSYAVHYRGENLRTDNIHPAMHHSRGFYRFFVKHYRPAIPLKFLLKFSLMLRLAFVISLESIKKVFHDINFSPNQ